MLMIASTGNLLAQRVKGNKKVVKETRAVEAFRGLDVGGIFNVYITQGNQSSLVIEADENLLDHISTNVSNAILHISSNKIKNATRLNVYITNPVWEKIEVGGASNLSSENTLSGTQMDIRTSGAAEAQVDVDVDELTSRASGASQLTLTGSATTHTARASGAADISARRLETNESFAEASGAANIRVNATEKVQGKTSGAGDVDVSGNPSVIETNDKHWRYDNNVRVRSWDSGDTTTVKVGGVVVKVIEGDSTEVSLGNHNLVVDDRGNVKWRRSRIQKFNGHWGGIDIGINGYVDQNQSLSVPEEYNFLDLKYEKSIDFNLNIYEQNINLANNKFGLITGIGLRWNNYRFDDNVALIADSSSIYGYRDHTQNWLKSKLVVNYLKVPLLFEYQTNRFSRSNSFHITAGMVLGWRYATHTKRLYKDGGRQKPKKWDSYHLNPFRYDATVRLGWGIINLYATYSLNTLFKDGRGPELYPFAMGITLLGW